MAQFVQNEQDITLCLDDLAHVGLGLGRIYLGLELTLSIVGDALAQAELF